VNGFFRRGGAIAAAAITGGSAANFTINNGGTYEHNYTTVAGTIPLATWSTGSTCSIIGYTTSITNPANLGQSFHHFTWNCPSQTGNINLLGLLTTVNGNFNLANAGTATITYNSNTPPTPILTIGGNCTINANFNLNNGTSTPTFNIAGNYSQTGGTISKGGGGVVTINFNKHPALKP
jgi:hypothetical protein